MIFNIKRFAIHDGPGIRTTVFLKGCPLDCLWCHNPEGKSREKEFMWCEEKCMSCRDCQHACIKNAIYFLNDLLHLDREKCNFCEDCVNSCHSQALKLIGKNMTVNQIMEEIEKDLLFYDESRGGITFSGGEPLNQPRFLQNLLEASEKKGIHTAVDTCGYTKWDVLAKISEHVDLFLYDLKMIDPKSHIKFTGVSNKLILHNLSRLSRIGQALIIRFALIPNVNDDEQNIIKLGEFVSQLENVREIHILPYHRGGLEKSKRLMKIEDSLFTTHDPSAETLNRVVEKLRNFGLQVQVGG